MKRRAPDELMPLAPAAGARLRTVKALALGLALGIVLWTGPSARAADAPTPIGEGYDRFNASMSLGYARFKDRITDVRIAGAPVVDSAEPTSAEFVFALDLMFPVFSSALWVGTSLNLSSGSDGTRNDFDRETLLTHGSVAAQLRYNLYRPPLFEDFFLYLSVESGLYSQSFMVPYNNAPLRLSATGSGGAVILGLQRRDGAFVALLYEQYRLDEFDVKLQGATENLAVTGTVEGQGLQLQLGYRWF